MQQSDHWADVKIISLKITCGFPFWLGLKNTELRTNHYMGCVGYTLIPQEDGTVFFSVEIQPEVAVPQQDSYQLSLYICTEDVDLDGNPIEGTRHSMDWIVTLVPEKAE